MKQSLIIHSVPSFSEYTNGPGTVLGLEDTAVYKTPMFPPSQSLYCGGMCVGRKERAV